MAFGAGQRRARGRCGVRRAAQPRAQGARAALSRHGGTDPCRRPASGRTLRRHAPARRGGPRARHGPAGTAARRAAVRARRADPRQASGRDRSDLVEGTQDGGDDHQRCRRGDPAGRPHHPARARARRGPRPGIPRAVSTAARPRRDEPEPGLQEAARNDHPAPDRRRRRAHRRHRRSPRPADGGAGAVRLRPAARLPRGSGKPDRGTLRRVLRGQEVLSDAAGTAHRRRRLQPLDAQGRVRLADRPFRLRQVDRAVDDGRAQRDFRRRHRARQQGSHHRRPRPRGGVPVAVAVPLAHGEGERRHRRRPGLPARQPRRARGHRDLLPFARRPGRRHGQARGGPVERHEAARRHCPRLRAVAEAAAARRAVRHARLAHPLAAARGADGGVVAHAGDRDLRHPRRRRGHSAGRPRGDDDQRAERPHRPDHGRGHCAPAHAARAARSPGLLRIPPPAPVLPRRIRARRDRPHRRRERRHEA